MRQITDVQELRGIQLATLDNIVAFCDAHGINYSLSSGTLIGAVRHKGYIPWDDDIDLYMLRDDYERFLDTFKDDDGVYSVDPDLPAADFAAALPWPKMSDRYSDTQPARIGYRSLIAVLRLQAARFPDKRCRPSHIFLLPWSHRYRSSCRPAWSS